MNSMRGEPIRLFLCGDVMTGRGIDQVLPYPAAPVLYEDYAKDARDYVQLAEQANGPIPKPVDFKYIWGDALEELKGAEADARIVNLETSITLNEIPWPEKGINYRMSPKNIPCLTAARIDCCCLANNHILDWDYAGLDETLVTLDTAGIRHAGAGPGVVEASTPAVLDIPKKGRVLVFALGSVSSGIPWEWRATEHQPGVRLLEDLSEETARRLGAQIRLHKQVHDVVVVSIHWGGNWGYSVSADQADFAHGLIDAGADVVHGHSSHHVKAIEVYRDRLILYGCGDFITDYEGISGYEEFRSDLSLMYLIKMHPHEGRLLEVRLVPMQTRRFRLNRALRADAQWLCKLLNELGKHFTTRAQLGADNVITLRW